MHKNYTIPTAENLGQRLILVLSLVLIVFLLNLMTAHNALAAPVIQAAEMNSFCKPTEALDTPYGYMEATYLADGAGNILSSNTLTLPYNTTTSSYSTYIDVNYKIETWFCNQRVAALELRNFQIVIEGTATNLFTPNNASNRLVCPNPLSSKASENLTCGAPGDYTTYAGYEKLPAPPYGSHKLMDQSPWVPGRLSIPATWADGDTKRLCLVYDEPKSGYSDTWYVGEREACYDITLNREKVWSLSAISTADVATATIGDTITWTHIVTNDGPTATSGTIDSWAVNQGLVDVGNSGSTSVSIAKDVVVRNFNSTYVVTAADVGTSICRGAAFDPESSLSSNTGYGTQACVSVPYDYELQPSLSVNKPKATYGESITVGRLVTNTGPTVSKPAQWQFNVGLIPAGGGDPAAGVTFHSNAPCTFYGISSCAPPPIGSNSGSNVIFPLNSTNLNNYLYDIPATQQVGSRICYILSVKDRSHDSTEWASIAECTKVIKRPLVQVWGHDVRVGNSVEASAVDENASVQTSSFSVATLTYGSWAEYGIFAPSNGTINSYSGSSLAGGGRAASDITKNALTFANTPAMGRWASAEQSASIDSATGSANGDFTDSDLGDYSATIGDDEFKKVNWLSGTIKGTLSKNSTVVVKATGDLKITDNITLANTAVADLGKAPQIIIIAPNIVITNNVTRVDAWLVSSGIISTCDNPRTAPEYYWTGLSTLDGCNANKLQINGAVMANELQLRRTFGGQTGAFSEPAEVINLRADAYMMRTSNSGLSINTIKTTELPPRF